MSDGSEKELDKVVVFRLQDRGKMKMEIRTDQPDVPGRFPNEAEHYFRVTNNGTVGSKFNVVRPPMKDPLMSEAPKASITDPVDPLRSDAYEITDRQETDDEIKLICEYDWPEFLK